MLESQRDQEREDLRRDEQVEFVGDGGKEQYRCRGHERESDEKARQAQRDRALLARAAHVAQDGGRRTRADVPDRQRERFEDDRSGQTQEGFDYEGELDDPLSARSSSGQAAISPSAALLRTLSPSIAHFMRAGLIPMPMSSRTRSCWRRATSSRR
jgi:hypothetical protein